MAVPTLSALKEVVTDSLTILWHVKTPENQRQPGT